MINNIHIQHWHPALQNPTDAPFEPAPCGAGFSATENRSASLPVAAAALRLLVGVGGFHKWGYPKMDGLQWKIPLKILKWMI